jgi:hypothetical protein
MWKAMPFPEMYYCSAMAPHGRGTIQGEVQQTERGLSLLAFSADITMRDAMARHGVELHGILAVHLLKMNMCPKSYDWLQFLLDAYPLHAVEFTCFDCNWGTLPGFNTVFWEVRLY